jgi:DNA-binding MarR family transcriptional regulator
MVGSDDLDADARVLAFLTKTRGIMTSDAKYVAERTALTPSIVEATLSRLEASGLIRVDANGNWALASE